MNRSIILGHPFGNANVRQALTALSMEGMLDSFVTTLCAEQIPFLSIFPAGWQQEIRRRSYSMISPTQIVSHPVGEILRLFGGRAGRALNLEGRLGPSTDRIWSALDKHLAAHVRRYAKDGHAVYAYEDGALATFSNAPHLFKIYELPIGYWKSMHALMNEERDLKPEWASTLTGLSDGKAKLERKDLELELSNKIIVPSDFVKSSLPPHFAAKATVVRYGCPPPGAFLSERTSSARPLKVFFCGSLGQRKGISYLFEAVARMGSRVELTVVGSEVASCAALNKAMENVTWHRSLPRGKILELMGSQDVFVFPTLFEGRALVVLEALSQGLPVITTLHAGASDVVVDGRSGFLIPIRSADAIVNALEMLDRDRDLLNSMKEQALAMAATTTWEKYRHELVDALREPTVDS